MEKGLMKIETLAQYLDVSVPMLYKLKRRADFPKPVVLGNADNMQCRKYYTREAIDKWLTSLSANAVNEAKEC